MFGWTFEMILIFFAFTRLSCLSFVHSATDNDTSMPICPKNFSCPGFYLFKYPFYNASHTRCGLIKVNCTSNGEELQFEGQSYEIIRSNFGFDSSFLVHNSIIRNNFGFDSSFLIYNSTFQKLVEKRKCEALMNNFTSPSPLWFSISIQRFVILFKCTKQPKYAAEMNAYFDPLNYQSYSCKDYNFYYKHLINNIIVPNDLPHRCEVIRLPRSHSHKRRNNSNIFSLLSFRFHISFPLFFCKECHKKDGPCQIPDEKAQCLDAKNEKTVKKLILIPVLAGSLFILMISSVIFIIWRRYKSNAFLYFSSKDKSQELEDGSLFFGVSVFSYAELEVATQNFDPSRELGDGGFGAVYYGKLRDGREVAVKRLYEHNYKQVQQFMNEVEILTRLQHPNLVLLYGCTSRQSRELLLVYEYIANGTVADHLHGEQANPSLLTWPIRMKIAIETATALVYLHASEIIHRDVKTCNILLDHNFCVKVADFGLSRLLPNDVTHVSTAPQGTPGYVDPQYHQRYQLTDKSDVYSFGVVLIELISAMQAVDVTRSPDEITLANLAINRIQRCALDQLIDPVLGSDSNAEIKMMIMSVAELAFRCLQFDSEMRPTMNEVLDVLEDIQANGRIEAHDSIRELKNVEPPPSPEAKDTVALLKDLPHSPVSVTGKWHSNSSESTTLSISGDRLPMKNPNSI